MKILDGSFAEKQTGTKTRIFSKITLLSHHPVKIPTLSKVIYNVA